MRLLDPPSRNMPTTAEIKARAEQARSDATKALAKSCLRKAKHLIQEHDQNQILQELHAIFKDCADLAKDLSVQKMRVDVVRFDGLPLRYQSGSPYLQPHGLHVADLDDDPQALDDKRVILVVNPAIVVHGTTSGCDYEQFRVWKKATVLIES
jgi:hypothetical protein